MVNDRLVILCIDDEPIRYNSSADIVVVSCRPEEIEFYFNKYIFDGVCLDYDMPFENGMYFAKEFLIKRSIPVAIVSLNSGGAASMKDLLDEYYVPCRLINAATNSFYPRVRKFFMEYQD